MLGKQVILAPFEEMAQNSMASKQAKLLKKGADDDEDFGTDSDIHSDSSRRPSHLPLI